MVTKWGIGFWRCLAMLSDGPKIALATSVPAGTFIILFAIAVVIRRRRETRSTVTFSQVTAPASVPRGLEHRPLPIPPESPGLVERKASFAQPEFAEVPITIRRLSADPIKEDEFLRVNSISSSLNVQYDPASENLPLGGRKGSVVSLSSEPEVGSGQRRLSVRRVSAGGLEDVVDIPCAQAEPDTEVQEIMHTPLTAGPSQPPIPQLDPPPSARSARRQRRPDSITITLKAKPGLRSAPLNTAAATKPAVEPTTGTPYTAKSPWTGSTVDRSAGVVFEAWRGFPTGDTRNEKTADIEDIPSPTHVHQAQAKGHPLPIATDTGRESSPDNSKATLLSVPATVERPRSATLPRVHDILPQSKRLSLQSLARTSPPPSPGAQAVPKTQSKVTYLSDVVKELDENPHLRITQADLGKTSSLSHLTKMLKVEATRPTPAEMSQPVDPRVSPLPPVTPMPNGLNILKDQ